MNKCNAMDTWKFIIEGNPMLHRLCMYVLEHDH